MKRHLLDVGPLRTLTVRRPSLNRRFPYKRRRHRCWIMSAGCEWLDRVVLCKEAGISAVVIRCIAIPVSLSNNALGLLIGHLSFL